ncbi:bifunctional Cyclophilin-like domain superfamily/Tetratricopeptide repeat/FKBP-type peptidyl-prolyl cis-trans isomerase domain/Cyclophilin-type peptidyl-prolyl cis-trans isomerase domain/Tetratricopeptide-like helical domain superfamily/Tetratricopeptide repeat 2/Cyclophilin-type peptidyl-prolyl cis-trans isomerase [Babesia duncani]|uniref:peptidylprolyl isomerase n=1 Tax=Babesia duncani TaxID=323732 RepID=A0AAD9UQ55_9APIC|nr:bifunctional Cyclophilin-like domain superfamily/Tetratricopeptide repeat/FKBP-type peptidyl-prolyl cis-trans isomerase domain/Cyclophilin-type peptidyl-prolyl cis-trans isomerase domain/Tetratricopeptide-like helical domain superfamily/Tetratricopeptide repeat 2/Cyclophilin-type peptidyl-prolyl cis-trans isomerase [Babesia duncani]
MTESVDLTGDGGVLKTIIKPSKFFEQPEQGHEVEVHYTGKLDTGFVFDSSHKRQTTFKFVLGDGNVIKGWEVGVAAMNIGETALLVIKPEYGYGAAGSGSTIPPNATLHFEIELINSRIKPKQKWEMSMDEKIQAAADAKVEGNAKFSQERILAAITYYEDGISYLSTRDEWPEDAIKASNVTKLQCHLNLANCYIKTEDFANAETHATEALNIDPVNIKGLYRRGLARVKQGDFKEAIDDLSKLIKIEPTNAAGVSQLKLAKEKYTIFKQRERNVFGSVFKKMNLYDEKSGIRNLDTLPRVFLDISITGHVDVNRLVIALFEDTVPKTVENFKSLCDENAKLTFKGNKFHRLIKGFMIQGGDITNGDGTGGACIYGDQFDDEGFKDSHSERGLLSMANCGPNTNNSQFFITFVPTKHLDGKHVVFGKIVEGMEFLDILENLSTGENDRPEADVTIEHCGTL